VLVWLARGRKHIFVTPTNTTLTQPVRDRAWALVRDDAALLAKATPALHIAIELKKVEGCARKPLIPTAEKDGDKRSLPFLQQLVPVHKGCGIFGLQPCGDCFGDRSDIQKAIAAITARENKH
jgi:hypothetical protein